MHTSSSLTPKMAESCRWVFRWKFYTFIRPNQEQLYATIDPLPGIEPAVLRLNSDNCKSYLRKIKCRSS